MFRYLLFALYHLLMKASSPLDDNSSTTVLSFWDVVLERRKAEEATDLNSTGWQRAGSCVTLVPEGKET